MDQGGDEGRLRHGYVTWDAYRGEHARLADRIDNAHTWAREQFTTMREWAREQHADLDGRLTVLEDAEEKRRDHRWMLALALLTGLLLPLIVAAVIAYGAAHGP